MINYGYSKKYKLKNKHFYQKKKCYIFGNTSYNDLKWNYLPK